MAENAYSILFEPVRIGPVTAPNRFYQVPHCTGLGHAYPNAMAALRGMKAEGGWGVVSSQLCEIHPTSDLESLPYDRIWDDSDIPILANMTSRVHAHGALAALQLGHVGIGARNFYSRLPAIGPGSVRNTMPMLPAQCRHMDIADIREFRGWHKAAVRRGLEAGFDIIYVNAAHNMALPAHFLSRRYNKRTDEYGGSLENRARLLRELIEDTREAVRGKAAVAVRFPVDELMGAAGLTSDGEGREVIEMLAELPDLWDVNISGWMNDSMSSRFAQEGFQESYIAFVKSVTTKPVVGVGRFTSPDTMVSQIKRGILDLIGAARPSIADPFLPNKIKEQRLDEIRECIGCNVCISAELFGTPIRCTQNPTIGEEWRRGWHPERLPAKRGNARVLVIGAGPAGLECTMSLGKRGYEVTLAEAGRELGGRVLKESLLPAFRSWIRVRDHRVNAIEKLSNISVFRESRLSREDVLSLGFDHIVIATGASWRRDGIGGSVHAPIAGTETVKCLTPDDVLSGAEVPGPVLIYDDDHYYLGSALAEFCRGQGKDVVLVTPASDISSWTAYTLEQRKIQAAVMRAGIGVHTGHVLSSLSPGAARIVCVHTGQQQVVPCGSVILLTAKVPDDDLYNDLSGREAELKDIGIASVTRIGDCLAPATIASAVFAGRDFAMRFQERNFENPVFARERILLVPTTGT